MAKLFAHLACGSKYEIDMPPREEPYPEHRLIITDVGFDRANGSLGLNIDEIKLPDTLPKSMLSGGTHSEVPGKPDARSCSC